MSMIPYTHWAYFPDEVSARACTSELQDYVTRIREVKRTGEPWLLLAGRDVEIDDLPTRHAEVESIVARHGGMYDGGEATYENGTGAVVDPMLTEGRPDLV